LIIISTALSVKALDKMHRTSVLIEIRECYDKSAEVLTYVNKVSYYNNKINQ